LNNVIKFKTEAPFIDIHFDKFTGVVDFAKKLWEGFKGYANSLKEIVEEKLPELLHTAEELPHEAEEVKNSVSHEFDGLDIMKKGKALM
jgi:hypothetical protein